MTDHTDLITTSIEQAPQPTQMAVDLFAGVVHWMAKRYGNRIAAEELYRWADDFATRDPS